MGSNYRLHKNDVGSTAYLLFKKRRLRKKDAHAKAPENTSTGARSEAPEYRPGLEVQFDILNANLTAPE